MKRIRYIDAAKGFGILLVIIHHTYGFRNGQFFNACFMAMFFMLSTLTYRERTELSSLREGWRRAWPLLRSYLLYLPALILLECAIKHWLRHETLSLGWLLEGIGGMLYSRISLYPAGVPHYQEIMLVVPVWFVTALAAGYMLFIPLQRFFGRLWLQNRKAACIAGVFFTLACIVISDLLSRLPVMLPWSLDMILVTALFMLAGYILQKTHLFSENRSLKSALLTAACALAIYVCALGLNHATIDYAQRLYGSGGSGLFVLIGLSGSLFFIAVCFLIRNTLLAKGLAFLGRHSLFILVFHQAIHTVLFQIMVGKLYLRYTVGLAIVEWVLMLIILICGILILERVRKRWHLKKTA